MAKDNTRALVLAAGVGTRLDPLTKSVPKPLVPVANRPVMEHVLRLLKRHNINDISANLHYMADMIPEYFQTVQGLEQNLHFVKEEVLSGDAGGMRACKKHLQGSTFIVLMGDIITDIDLSFLISRHKRSGALASIALKSVEDVQHFGVARLDKNGLIQEFQEKPKPEEAISNLASTGIYVFEPQIFDYVPRAGNYMFGKELFPKLLRMGVPLNGVRVLGHWADIGTIETYKQTSFDAINGVIDIDMPNNTCQSDRQRYRQVNVQGTAHIGKDCRISAGVRLIGNNIVGDNCSIGPGAVLEDCIVWSGTTIAGDADLKNCVLGHDSAIAAGSHHQDETIVQGATADLDTRLARLRIHADVNGFMSNRRMNRSA
ncbi:MAG: NDP-sugar synthase [Cyanobacteria bacterium SZAS LIN-2]|nr:NDP-sugar synthase [Cyanobacteria bacterium SZAS LIN-2]